MGDSVERAGEFLDAGADVLELGIPYVDPSLDGQVVRSSMERALSTMTSEEALQEVARVRWVWRVSPVAGSYARGNGRRWRYRGQQSHQCRSGEACRDVCRVAQECHGRGLRGRQNAVTISARCADILDILVRDPFEATTVSWISRQLGVIETLWTSGS